MIFNKDKYLNQQINAELKSWYQFERYEMITI